MERDGDGEGEMSGEREKERKIESKREREEKGVLKPKKGKKETKIKRKEVK